MALGAFVSVALVLGLLAAGQALRSRGEHTGEPATPGQTGAPRSGTPAPPAALPQNGLAPEVQLDSANVLPGMICGILDGGKRTDKGGVFLWGWAWDPRSQAPATAVILVDNGKPLSPPVRVFRERPDVAAFKKIPRLVTSGWSVLLPADQLTGNEHGFEAFAILGDQKLGRLGGKISIRGTQDRGAGSP